MNDFKDDQPLRGPLRDEDRRASMALATSLGLTINGQHAQIEQLVRSVAVQAYTNGVKDLNAYPAAVMHVPVVEQPDKLVRIVMCAANRYNGTALVLGARHNDEMMRNQRAVLRLVTEATSQTEEQGFVDQHGVFMNRREAFDVAEAAGQLRRWRPIGPRGYQRQLHSEDLY